jgi:glutamine amidotransferase
VSEVVVVDYGMGNLLSVQRGLEHCGATVQLSADHNVILEATKVVLPGVGAFADAMNELNHQGLTEVIKEVAKRGTPLLGICLGMQMLLDESEEFGRTKGLSLIPGNVTPIPKTTVNGMPQKIPHIGWSALVIPEETNNWTQTILKNIEPGEACYFVHSYMASPSNSEHNIANCVYGGRNIPAVIGNKNIFGCQFHPEKSGEVGLTILRNFLAL